MRSDTINMIGRKLGRLTVIGYAEKKVNEHYWNTVCDCGTRKVIGGAGMRAGLIQSCGCLHRERVRKTHQIFEGVEKKHCPHCDTWKELTAFCRATDRVDGLCATCSDCKNAILRAYRKANPEKADEWARLNPERANANSQRYRKEHPEWWKEWNAKRDVLPENKLRHRMSAEMRYCLKKGKNGKSWESLVGYTLDNLKKRLSKTMPKGYTWDDLSELHIDHIIPVTAFNIEDEHSLDFHRCWDLRNLQLLPKMENLMKKDKLDKPFQPSLAMGL